MSIAYYLATRFNIKSTIVESTGIAAAASGKSGGFLARGWGSGPTGPLHEISYDMHEELAKELSLSSYRKLVTLEVDGNVKRRKKSVSNIASWLNGPDVSSAVMDEETAQVTSMELVSRMWEVAQSTVGSELVLGRALGISYGSEASDSFTATANGVHVIPTIAADGSSSSPTAQFLPADKVILAMGPWTSVAVEDWCGYHLPMEGIKSTSLVFRNVPRLGSEEPYACFCAEDDREQCHLEIYPRNNNEVYICGIGGSDHVRGNRLRYPDGDCASAENVAANPARVQAAYRALARLSSEFEERTSSSSSAGADIMQACMRPCTSDALPVMGLVPDTHNVFVSTGHNCWGILWAPVSGLAMSELLVQGQASCIDLKAFRPQRILRPTTSHQAKFQRWKQTQEQQPPSSSSAADGSTGGTAANDAHSSTRGKKRGEQDVGEQW